MYRGRGFGGFRGGHRGRGQSGSRSHHQGHNRGHHQGQQNHPQSSAKPTLGKRVEDLEAQNADYHDDFTFLDRKIDDARTHFEAEIARISDSFKNRLHRAEQNFGSAKHAIGVLASINLEAPAMVEPLASYHKGTRKFLSPSQGTAALVELDGIREDTLRMADKYDLDLAGDDSAVGLSTNVSASTIKKDPPSQPTSTSRSEPKVTQETEKVISPIVKSQNQEPEAGGSTLAEPTGNSTFMDDTFERFLREYDDEPKEKRSKRSE